MILVFRKYDHKGNVIHSEKPIERECGPDEKDGIIQELQADSWELECIA